MHYFSISLTFYCSICTLGGLGKHMVVKGSSSDGDEVMMGVTNLGDENGLNINVGNNCVGVVGKSANPPRNWINDSNSMSESMCTTLDFWI